MEYIKCIKRTCKVGDFKLETSEEQRLDWLDNSVRCWVLGAKMCRSFFCWSSAAVIELKRKGLIFLSSNTASNSNNKLDYFSNCSCWNGVWRNRVVWLQICFKEAAFYISTDRQQVLTRQNLKNLTDILPVKNNLLLYLMKLHLIKQLFYSTFWILADYHRFALRGSRSEQNVN